MRFNIYYTFGGGSRSSSNLPLESVGEVVKVIMENGGEITGIIDVEKD